MKYKTLKALAHNFTHSFVSLTNYFDNGYVIDDLKQLVRKRERISIFWLPERKQDELPRRILNSIERYKKDLPRLAQAMNADVNTIKEFRLDIYLKPNYQIAVEGYLVDDRGRTYISPVYEF